MTSAKEEPFRWLNRTLTTCACNYTLALNEKELHTILSEYDVPKKRWPKFRHKNGAKVVKIVQKKQDRNIAIVCLDRREVAANSSIVISGVLAHEAVHIWQWHAEIIGAYNDHGDEEEAYAIQSIFQKLLEELHRRLFVQKDV